MEHSSTYRLVFENNTASRWSKTRTVKEKPL